MSCKLCDECQDGNYRNQPQSLVVRVKEGGVAFYRWKNANIEMNGCDFHLREVFDALNSIQFGNRKNDNKN